MEKFSEICQFEGLNRKTNIWSIIWWSIIHQNMSWFVPQHRNRKHYTSIFWFSVIFYSNSINKDWLKIHFYCISPIQNGEACRLFDNLIFFSSLVFVLLFLPLSLSLLSPVRCILWMETFILRNEQKSWWYLIFFHLLFDVGASLFSEQFQVRSSS